MTNANRIPGWVYEFDESYDVPAERIEAAGLRDHSWHNDACPSFAVEMIDPANRDVHDLRLWVEHPEVDQRDSGTDFRYSVNYQPWSNEPVEGVTVTDYGSLYEGDDLEAALAKYAEVQSVIEAELARRKEEALSS